jgi:hypothetical protein
MNSHCMSTRRSAVRWIERRWREKPVLLAQDRWRSGGRRPWRIVPTHRVPSSEDRLGGVHAVERSWKTGVHGHLNDHLHQFLPRAADVEGGVEVDLELRAGVGERGQRCYDGEFPRASRWHSQRCAELL